MTTVLNYSGTFPATEVIFIRDPIMGGFSTVRSWWNPSARSTTDIYVYDKNIVSNEVVLGWTMIEKTDLTNLLTFLDVIEGTDKLFHFTDPNGDPFTAYFLGPDTISWNPVDSALYDFSIDLLVTISIAIDNMAMETGVDLILTENSVILSSEY